MGQFDTTIGVTLVGLFFNTYLYGLVTMQFLRYWNIKFNDPLWVKAIVGTLFFLDTMHSAIAVYFAWDLCVKNFDNPAILEVIPWESALTAFITAIVAIISQMFLGYRVYRLTKSWPLYALIFILAFLGLIGAFAAGTKSFIIVKLSRFHEIQPYVILWLSCQTAADLVVTASLTYVLRHSRTGFKKTDTILNNLVRGAVRTGAFAAIFALGDLFTFLLAQQTALYAMFVYPIGRIYTNTLLDTLNSRARLQSELAGGVEVHNSSSYGRTAQSQHKSNGIPLGAISVRTVQETHMDDPSAIGPVLDLAGEKYGSGSDHDLFGPRVAPAQQV